MSDTDQNQTDKAYEPTQEKLRKAREKGEIARSSELSVAVSYLGIVLAIWVFGPISADSIGTALSAIFEASSAHVQKFDVDRFALVLRTALISVSAGVAALFVMPAAAVFLSLLGQNAIVFTPNKIRPKMSRVSIIQNAKQKYGRSGLFEFAKSFAKLTVFCIVLWIFLILRAADLIETSGMPFPSAVLTILRISGEFLAIVVVVSISVGFLDLLWQRAEHLRKNRMDRKELTDETKESEGDPYLKQERRSRAQSIAASQMLADVPKADVVIVNPTHYAVVLAWSRAAGSAPKCTAKGVDEMAATIRRIASESGVPIHSDPPTARALYRVVEVGQEIDAEFYRAGAASIRFAEKMRSKARQRII